MSAPVEVLLARALYWMERATLQLGAGRHTEAAESIDKATRLVHDALTSD